MKVDHGQETNPFDIEVIRLQILSDLRVLKFPSYMHEFNDKSLFPNMICFVQVDL